MSDDYEGYEDQESEGYESEGEESSDEGMGRIYERMDEMAANQQQLADQLQEAYYGAPEDEEEPEEDVEFEDEQGNLTEEGARALIADMVAEQVADQMAPRDYQDSIAQRDEDFEDLREDLPEMQDDRVAQAVLNRALEWADRVDPSIVDRPEFVDLVEATYKAMRYDEPAEKPEREVVLGSAQGAAPQYDDQTDWGQRIVDAAEKLRPRI